MDKNISAIPPKTDDVLLRPSLDDWLPQDYMARFIDEAIDAMDISVISDHYKRELRGTLRA